MFPLDSPGGAPERRGSALQRAVDRMVTSRWLIGDPDEPGERVAKRVLALTIGSIVVANAVGALVVLSYAVLALPKPDLEDQWQVRIFNLLLTIGYVIFAVLVGIRWGRRRVESGPNGTAAWLQKDLPPTPSQRNQLLRAPLRIGVVMIVLWTIATVIFTVANLQFDPLLALGIAPTVALGGLTTSMTAYVLAELALRPLVARAEIDPDPSPADRRGVPGVATRLLLTWALGTAVPVVGLIFVGVAALTPVDIDKDILAITVIVLSGITLVFGALVTMLAAYATVHPLGSLRRGLRAVQAGDYHSHVPVWDSTEIGTLQAGFNAMVDGLSERERIRDLFGRQVGREVAAQALESGAQLGGEVRTVSVLFVDVVGSTELATKIPPTEVVALLNRFLGEVIEIVESEGGWINKFEGDAALAIFGAPGALDDAPGRALAAGRRIAARLPEVVPEVRAAVGVSTGEAVAGHVGAEQRYEYTVIGDPVNEAARLTELAKGEPGLVLGSGVSVRAAAPKEARRWEIGADKAVLRGRNRATELARPVGAGSPTAPAGPPVSTD